MQTKVLKIDIDVKQKYFSNCIKEFIETRKLILNYYGLKAEEIKVEKSRRGYHIIIILDKYISVTEALKLQCILGDDHNRANFNFFRLENFGERIANLFNLLYTEKARRVKNEKKNRNRNR